MSHVYDMFGVYDKVLISKHPKYSIQGREAEVFKINYGWGDIFSPGYCYRYILAVVDKNSKETTFIEVSQQDIENGEVVLLKEA